MYISSFYFCIFAFNLLFCHLIIKIGNKIHLVKKKLHMTLREVTHAAIFVN